MRISSLAAGRKSSLGNSSIKYSPAELIPRWQPPKILNNEAPKKAAKFKVDKFGNQVELEAARRRSKIEYRMKNLMPENLTYGDADVIYYDEFSNEMRDHLRGQHGAIHNARPNPRRTNPNNSDRPRPAPVPAAFVHLNRTRPAPTPANFVHSNNNPDVVQFLDVDEHELPPNTPPIQLYSDSNYDAAETRANLASYQDQRERRKDAKKEIHKSLTLDKQLKDKRKQIRLEQQQKKEADRKKMFMSNRERNHSSGGNQYDNAEPGNRRKRVDNNKSDDSTGMPVFDFNGSMRYTK
jgi:hypothetical protein